MSDALAQFGQRVKARSGLLMRGDKGYFTESRLAALARREGAVTVAELIERVAGGEDERLLDAVCEALAVTDTAFLRDPQVFAHLRETALPELAARRGDAPLQVWCAGCATGQEAYSLAMLAAEMVDIVPKLRLEIVATDLSQRALEKAHSGLYTQFEVQRGLPIRYLLRHFERAGEMWSVAAPLRTRIRWRRLNLLEARRSLRRFDLILCRYVTSYLDTDTHAGLLDQFAPAMAEDGVLVMGLGEAPPTGFREARPELGVFSPDSQVRMVA